ncbi:MAG: hypothetical protein GXP31_02405 [Kiritimatiellaeota bacterium]|nr:hypothetical protein [Kiritimatiellota bacterium]
MKWTMPVKLFAALWVGVSQPSRAATVAANLLANPGFESDPRQPAGWVFKAEGGAQGAAAVVAAPVHAGAHAFRVQKTGGRGFFTLTLRRRVPVTPGQQYEARARLHVAEAFFGAKAYLMVRQFPKDGVKYLPPNMFSPNDQRPAIRCRPGEWVLRSQIFTARPRATTADVTLVVSGNPSTVVWDDLYLGPPLPWPRKTLPLSPPELTSETEVLARLAARPAAVAGLRTESGRPVLRINGKPVAPLFHLMCFWRPFTSYNRDFARAGVHVHVCPIPLAPYTRDGTHLWKGPGQYDFRPADAVLMHALRGDPDGYLVPDLCLIGAWPGWGDAHPDEICQDSRGLRAIGKFVHNTRYGKKLKDPMEFWCPSYYSTVYRRDGAEVVRAYVEHLRTTPFFKAVVGFSITGGDDGQFSLWRRSGPAHEPDYSPAARHAFRAWLKARYGAEDALRRAWRQPTVTFAQARLPTPEERRAPGRVFRDPLRDTPVVDYARFLSEGTCDLVRAFAGAAKKAAGKPVFCTTYWGAHLMGASLNHAASRRLMRTPEIDIIHAPAGYGPWRRPGMPGACNTTPGSLRLHNKLFLQELDLRTFTRSCRSAASAWFLAQARDLDEFRAIHRRETGMMYTAGMGAWYYDMAGGWFHDPGIMRDIAEVRNWFARSPDGHDDRHSGLAVIADEESTHWICDSARSILYTALSRNREALALSGVPYTLFELGDLERPELRRFRVILFLNAWRLTDRQLRFIESNLKRDGRTLVWMFAPGYIGDNGLSIEQTQRLVGMRLDLSPAPTTLECEAVPGDHPLTRGLLPRQGVSARACKFWITDRRVVPLARYAGSGELATAARAFDQWRSVYIASPGGLGPVLLNNVARWAGAYVCTTPGDAVYLSGRLLCVHGVRGGRRTFRLPRRATVIDLPAQKTLARDTDRFEADIPLQKTRWFELRW